MPPDERAAPVARPNPWPALAVLCLANFLILLDTTIVNTAAPDMMRGLGAGIGEILWVLNGYLLAFASLLIVFGRLGDLVGPRLVFVAGLGLFTVASVLCAVSGSPEALIAARVVQGVAAAALVPQALVLISAIFPADRRGAAFGIFTAVAGVAAVSGPTLGGFLVTEMGWQSIFYLNVPVGLAGLLLALWLVPDLRPGRRHRFDLVGVLLATAGLVAVVYPLIEWRRGQWGLLAAGLVLLALFAVWERRAAEPLVPLDLFGDRNYAIATLVTFIVSFSLYGLLLVYVLETQNVLGMSPLRSGVSALPWTLSLGALAPLAGRFADRIGGRILLVAGLAIYAVGLLGVAYVPTATSTAATFVLPLILVGVGMGMTIAPATTEAMRYVAPERSGAASGVLNTARQAGAAVGAAVTGAVLQSQLDRGLLAATRPTLSVVAAVVLAGSGLALFMPRLSGNRLSSNQGEDATAASREAGK